MEHGVEARQFEGVWDAAQRLVSTDHRVDVGDTVVVRWWDMRGHPTSTSYVVAERCGDLVCEALCEVCDGSGDGEDGPHPCWSCAGTGCEAQYCGRCDRMLGADGHRTSSGCSSCDREVS